jgi:gas vesicle protein
MSHKIENSDFPEESDAAKITRAGMQLIGGIVPFAGGLFSAAAGAWSEKEQERVNDFLKHWIKMLEDEIKEKQQTIIEIMARLDMHDEKIATRIESKEYQSLLKKTFREWAGTESEQKRSFIRNVLSNAAATDITSDDVIRLFIDWIKNYSELHFQVIGAVYNSSGISRGEIWQRIGKGVVREDSADADLYKLLFRDLSMGGIVRQHRETTYDGRFLKETPQKRSSGGASREMTSAFDRNDKYVLTGLGQQFVHYAMTDLPPKLEYKS